MSAQVVNSHLVCDPTIWQPGFDLPQQQWSLLNRFCTEQGHCGACRRKWQLTLSNPVPWQNWMAAYLRYTLQMKTLFRGWPVMVHDTHTRRILQQYITDRLDDEHTFGTGLQMVIMGWGEFEKNLNYLCSWDGIGDKLCGIGINRQSRTHLCNKWRIVTQYHVNQCKSTFSCRSH